LAWPDQFPLPGPTATRIENDPAYVAQRRAETEACAFCKAPLGQNRIQITVDTAIHAGGCPNPDAARDSFGDPVDEAKPELISLGSGLFARRNRRGSRRGGTGGGARTRLDWEPIAGQEGGGQ